MQKKRNREKNNDERLKNGNLWETKNQQANSDLRHDMIFHKILAKRMYFNWISNYVSMFIGAPATNQLSLNETKKIEFLELECCFACSFFIRHTRCPQFHILTLFNDLNIAWALPSQNIMYFIFKRTLNLFVHT